MEIDDYIDAGEAVIVLVRISATGRASGAQLEARLAHLWVIGGDGKVIRGEVYRSAEEALDAVVPVGQPRPVSLAVSRRY